MGVRELAELDLAAILEDEATGGGWAVSVIAPDGTEGSFTGFSSDISQLIDPLTGQAVSGRLATVALRLSSLITAFRSQGLPVAVAEATATPWVVRFNDINGVAFAFKIVKSMPDRALGILSVQLEVYND